MRVRALLHFVKWEKNIFIIKILKDLCYVCTDLSQVQCIKSYQAQEHDELTLEKADILQAKTITSDGNIFGYLDIY